ncbi:MAG: hypothetical protein WDA65_08655 [Christensenellales bacterium]
MESTLVKAIMESGIETLLIAVCVNVFTAAVKIPIKKLSKKLNAKAQINRFITLLPLLLSFGFTTLYMSLFIKAGKLFEEEFIILWLSSSSLSLALYAIFEKFFGGKIAETTKEEMKSAQEIIEMVAKRVAEALPPVSETVLQSAHEDTETNPKQASVEKGKIILRGGL